MVAFVYILLEISIDEYYILSPEHHEEAPRIVHERQAIPEIIRTVNFDHLLDGLIVYPNYQILKRVILGSLS